jgi:hypothetical protein
MCLNVWCLSNTKIIAVLYGNEVISSNLLVHPSFQNIFVIIFDISSEFIIYDILVD